MLNALSLKPQLKWFNDQILAASEFKEKTDFKSLTM